jgi:hypothetical protein
LNALPQADIRFSLRFFFFSGQSQEQGKKFSFLRIENFCSQLPAQVWEPPGFCNRRLLGETKYISDYRITLVSTEPKKKNRNLVHRPFLSNLRLLKKYKKKKICVFLRKKN